MPNLELRLALPEDLPEIYNLLKLSFPDNELRSFDSMSKSMATGIFKILTLWQDSCLVLTHCFWDLDTFYFWEYLAVNPDFRNQHLASYYLDMVLSQKFTDNFVKNPEIELLKQAYTDIKPLIFEVEMPVTPIAKRRIAFYERYGFIVLPFAYRQPPLNTHTESLDLLVMSYQRSISQADFAVLTTAVREAVYSHL